MANWKKQYFQLLQEADAGKQGAVQQCIALKTKHWPKHLYRYRRLNTESSEKSRQEKESLERGRIWLSSPNDFNDPFDSACAIDVVEVRNLRIRERVESLNKENNLGLTPADVRRIKTAPHPWHEILKWRAEKDGRTPPTAAEARQICEQHWANSIHTCHDVSREEIQVGCFSEDASSILMWSHYADEHRGLCLEYDVAEMLQQVRHCAAWLHPVFYSLNRWDRSDRLLDSDQPVPTAPACHKAIDWQYEKEWRLVRPTKHSGGVQWIELPRPTRIILGARSSDIGLREHLDTIKSLAGVPRVEAKLSPTEFRIAID